MSLNKLHLIGNTGNDPETININESTKVSKFSLATSESYTDKQGQKVDTTDWHRIVCFGKLAEFAEKWIKKGTQLYIEGRVKYGSYENKEGVKIYTTDIIANSIQFVGKKLDNQEPENTAQTEKPSDSVPETDDLPF